MDSHTAKRLRPVRPTGNVVDSIDLCSDDEPKPSEEKKKGGGWEEKPKSGPVAGVNTEKDFMMLDGERDFTVSSVIEVTVAGSLKRASSEQSNTSFSLDGDDPEDEDGIPLRLVAALSDEDRGRLRILSGRNLMFKGKIAQLEQEMAELDDDSDTTRQDQRIKEFSVKMVRNMDAMLELCGLRPEAEDDEEDENDEDELFSFHGSGHDYLDQVITVLIQACLHEEQRDHQTSPSKNPPMPLTHCKDFNLDKLASLCDTIAQQENDGQSGHGLRNSSTQQLIVCSVVLEALHEAVRKFRSRRFNRRVIPIFSVNGDRDPVLPSDPDLERRFKARENERLLDDRVRDYVLAFEEEARTFPGLDEDAGVDEEVEGDGDLEEQEKEEITNDNGGVIGIGADEELEVRPGTPLLFSDSETESVADEPTVEMAVVAEEDDDESHCFCQGRSAGFMVQCVNQRCAIGWFHGGCIGLTNDSLGDSTKWYCPDCEEPRLTRATSSGSKRTKRRKSDGRKKTGGRKRDFESGGEVSGCASVQWESSDEEFDGLTDAF